MIIVFSHIDFIEGEAKMISKLFEEGMDRFHVKKLGSIDEFRNLIQLIPSRFHEKVVLHTNHSLKKDFPKLCLHTRGDQFSDKP